MLRASQSLIHARVHAVDGDVGAISDLYFDDEHWYVRYLALATGSWLRRQRVCIVPDRVTRVSSRRVQVELTREQIRNTDEPAGGKTALRWTRDRINIEPYSSFADERLAGASPMGPLGAGCIMPPPEIQVQSRARMHQQMHLEPTHVCSRNEVSGYRIEALNGDLGHARDFLFDDIEWTVQYVVVEARNWLPGKLVIVPTVLVQAVSGSDRKLTVAIDCQTLRGAPAYEPALLTDDALAKRVSQYYGLYIRPAAESRAASLRPM
jgi:hypothetical protein